MVKVDPRRRNPARASRRVSSSPPVPSHSPKTGVHPRPPVASPVARRNLALLGNAILALIEPGRHDSLNQAFLHHADHRVDHRVEALRPITKAAPQNP